MKATELRIGNLILMNCQEGGRLIDVNLEALGWVYESPDFYSPIPITEEWLLKLGATYHNFDGIHYIIHNNNFEIIFDVKLLLSINSGHDAIFLPHIKYIHQLQNIYFALAGEELTLK